MRRLPIVFWCFGFILWPGLASAATNVACVGDSITEGSGWCEALGTKLGADYSVSNFGVSGTTLLKSGDYPYWDCSQYTPSHDFLPNIVVIMLGTNDSKPQNWAHKSEFVADYEALIDTYTSLASSPAIYVNLPPPAGQNSYGISGTIIEDEVLPLVRQVAESKGATLVDVFSAFGGSDFDPNLFGSTADQVHPNAAGAQVICDTVYEALTAPATGGTGGAGGAGGAAGTSGAGGTGAEAGTAVSGGAGGTAPSGGTGGSGPSGGASPTGGAAATGATAGSGGVDATGGTLATGGSGTFGGTGGVVATGGMAATGGAIGTGGITAFGGTGGSSAASGTGGLTVAGGATTTGGAANSGGTPGSSDDAEGESDDKGCGCRVGGRSTPLGSTAAMLLALLMLRRRRTPTRDGSCPR